MAKMFTITVSVILGTEHRNIVFCDNLMVVIPHCMCVKRRKNRSLKKSDFISTLFSQKTTVNSQNFASNVSEYTILAQQFQLHFLIHLSGPTYSYLAENRTVCLISIIEVLLEQTRIISHPQSISFHSLISLFNIIVH